MTSESGPGNVTSAFQVLQEEVEKEIDGANRAVTDCLARRDHGDAEKSLQRSKALTAFRDRVAILQIEWQQLSASPNTGNEKDSGRRSNGRLPPGQRTPRKEFVKPILQVLEKMGGSGEANAVVERVGRIMKPVPGRSRLRTAVRRDAALAKERPLGALDDGQGRFPEPLLPEGDLGAHREGSRGAARPALSLR